MYLLLVTSLSLLFLRDALCCDKSTPFYNIPEEPWGCSDDFDQIPKDGNVVFSQGIIDNFPLAFPEGCNTNKRMYEEEPIIYKDDQFYNSIIFMPPSSNPFPEFQMNFNTDMEALKKVTASVITHSIIENIIESKLKNTNDINSRKKVKKFKARIPKLEKRVLQGLDSCSEKDTMFLVENWNSFFDGKSKVATTPVPQLFCERLEFKTPEPSVSDIDTKREQVSLPLDDDRNLASRIEASTTTLIPKKESNYRKTGVRKSRPSFIFRKVSKDVPIKICDLKKNSSVNVEKKQKSKSSGSIRNKHATLFVIGFPERFRIQTMALSIFKYGLNFDYEQMKYIRDIYYITKYNRKVLGVTVWAQKAPFIRKQINEGKFSSKILGNGFKLVDAMEAINMVQACDFAWQLSTNAWVAESYGSHGLHSYYKLLEEACYDKSEEACYDKEKLMNLFEPTED